MYKKITFGKYEINVRLGSGDLEAYVDFSIDILPSLKIYRFYDFKDGGDTKTVIGFGFLTFHISICF